MPPAIETERLVKEYGDLRALDEVSLRVEDGEFFGLLGPNGAGKTTFISILVGLVRLSGGSARVFGHDVVDDYREARDAIGIAPQEFNVDRFFPIEEVLMHKAGYHGIPHDEAKERAHEVLKTVGIYEKREQRFDWLSGGMKRRLLLARALVTDPDLLILDEPTAGVDVELRHDLWKIVSDLNDAGTTVLLTTHYIEEAERLCDRVAILDHGEVVTVETPDDLMDRGTDTIYVTLDDDLDEPPEFLTSSDRDSSSSSDTPSTPSTNPSALDRSSGSEPAAGGSEDYALDAWIDSGRLAVQVEDGGGTAPRLLQDLAATGHEVVDLEIARTSLEDVFVDLTERTGGVA